MYMNGQRKITYKSARAKGKQLERDVAQALCKIGINAKRVPMSGALAWLKGDVAELNLDGQQNSHIHECKNHQTLCLPEWWRQAKLESTKGEIPALHFRSNRRPAFTMMHCKDFDDLVFDYEQRRPEITLQLVDVPARKNFWKFYDQELRSPIDVYLADVDGDEVVIVLFDLYLRLRKGGLLQDTSSVQPKGSLIQPLPTTTVDTELAEKLVAQGTTAGSAPMTPA